jgi:hypothetical protein
MALISLTDLERLCGLLDKDSGSTSDKTETDWWHEFERELRKVPID